MRYGVRVDSISDNSVCENGNYYATPTGNVSGVTWTTKFASAPSSVSMVLEGSLNGTDWYIVDTSTGVNGELRSIATSSLFLRISCVSKTGGGNITASMVLMEGAMAFAGTGNYPCLTCSNSWSGNNTFTAPDTLVFKTLSGNIQFRSFGSGRLYVNDVLTFTWSNNSFSSVGNLDLGTSAGFWSNSYVRKALAAGTSPTISSGFGTSPTIAGKDEAFRVTIGSGGDTIGVVTFNTAYTNAPICIANNETSVQPVRTTSTTTNVTLSGTFTALDKVTVVCKGYI